jgi:hypothetical protein
MTCSGMDLDGIEEDFSTRGLPPIPIQDQKTIWNGRTIQVLHEVRHFLHIDKVLANIGQQHQVDTHFYERVFTDLTFEDWGDAEPYKDDPNYDIRFLECISDRKDFSFYFADHARTGTTYDTALNDILDDLNEKPGFNDGKKIE